VKLAASRILIVVNGLLVLALTAAWMRPDGTLRSSHWVRPAPIVPDFAAMASTPSGERSTDVSRFVATLERPVFSIGRRPPPQSSIVSAVAPPDPLEAIRLHGVFSSIDGGGIIASIDGKSRRVLLNESVGSWTIAVIKGSDVTFVRNSERRVLTLFKAKAVSAARPASTASLIGGDAPSPLGGGMDAQARAREGAAARMRAVDEMRAQAGLPPTLR
jgi:hypothetical protein